MALPALGQIGASPRNPGDWILPSDYPSEAILNDVEGTVSFTVDVGIDGRVQACVPTGGSASALLQSKTCEMLAKRAEFTPATDTEGRPVIGTYDGTVRWVIPEDRLAEGLRNRPREGEWDYSFVIERDGSVSECEIAVLDGPPRRWACGFPEGDVYPPFRGEDGEPVRKRVRMEGRITIDDPD
ncbi:energy transducer TonB [Alteriqipengyuania lutimaris]|uniref:energy transducer TonB n=1 Tax=Alteriqipengyuania lutimaris TaxID=1538146 RepID=UPI0015F17BF7|nr:energy transducer TonB [Alteriqipengyuania lutimaris]MBB3033104.1 protein TonB [Alteriqipengyuania lutimaris]